MKLIVVPEVRRQAAEAVVRAALAQRDAASYTLTLIRLPGRGDWTVHASNDSGTDAALAALIQERLRAAGL